MANVFLPDPALAPASIDLVLLYKRGSNAADRVAVLAAVEDFEHQQKLHNDFAVPHLAAAARERLEAAGVQTVDSDTFRSLYLEGKTPQIREQQDWAIDQRIVERLRAKIQPVIERIRQAVIADLEAHLPKGPHPDAVLAERYGLPAPQEGAVFRSIRAAAAAIRAERGKPIDLSLNARRRDTLSVYFAKPL